MSRTLTILAIFVLTLGTLLPSGARGGAICLGDGHHSDRRIEACCLAHCEHDAGILSPGWRHHDRDCHCTDVHGSGPAVVLTSRPDDTTLFSQSACPCDDWRALVGDETRPCDGPSRAPPWLDPGIRQRLAVVASVRLTI